MLASLITVEPDTNPTPTAALVAALPVVLIEDAIRHYQADRAGILAIGGRPPASFDEWLADVLRDRLYLRPHQWLIDQPKGGA